MSTKEQKERIELLQGTLDLLILRTLRWGPAHGHAIAKAIEFRSEDVLQVEQGSLYPALHRLIKRRWIAVGGGHLGEQPPGQVLPVDEQRATATGGGDQQVGQAGGGHRANSAAHRGRRTMKGRRKRMLEGLDQDIREHIERETQDNIERGMTPEAAAYAARRKFGNVTQVKEDTRNVWSVVWLEQMVEDMYFGLRMLRKNPGFAAVAVLTLALGIGANAAIFSVMNAVLLRPLAMEDPSRVLYVQEQWRDLFPGVSVGNFNDLAQQSTSFAKLCASNSASFNLATGEAPERVQGELASGNYFATFGVQPLAGRGFTTDEDKPGRGQVVVISERLWRTQLHADLAVVGQPLLLNGAPYTVVGIMPKTFDPLLNDSDIWIPEAFTAKQLADYDNHYLNVMGRLKTAFRRRRRRQKWTRLRRGCSSSIRLTTKIEVSGQRH